MRYTETLNRILNGDYDQASPEERAAAIRDLVNLCSVAAGALAIQPIPLLDVALIIPIQIGMVQGIGRIHGHRLDSKSVIEIIGSFGAGLVAQNVMMATAKLVPFAGHLAAAAMAYALTYAIGEVATHYFSTGRGIPREELKEMFQAVYKRKKAEREQAMKGAPSLKEKLEQLKEARAAGLLTEEEFERKKQELLAGL
jgi:uncharacterized protein (DUF697 family)